MAQTLLSKMIEVEGDMEDIGDDVDDLDEGLDNVEAKLDSVLVTAWAICALLVVVAVMVASRWCFRCARPLPPPPARLRPPRRPGWDLEMANGQHRRAEVRPASSLPNMADGEWLDEDLEGMELGAVGPVLPEASTSAAKEEEKKGAKKMKKF